MKKYKIEFSETVLRVGYIEINATTELDAKIKFIEGDYDEKNVVITDSNNMSSLNIISINEVKK